MDGCACVHACIYVCMCVYVCVSMYAWNIAYYQTVCNAIDFGEAIAFDCRMCRDPLLLLSVATGSVSTTVQLCLCSVVPVSTGKLSANL